MNPAPGLVDSWFTLPFVIGLAWLVALVALVLWLLRVGDVDLTDLTLTGDDDPFVNGVSRCTIDDCTRPGAVLLPGRSGHIFVCRQHGRDLRSGPGRPAPYDQELDSTDLGRWEQEMRA